MDSYVKISRKSKHFKRRKRVPRAHDGMIKRIITDIGEYRYYCIDCHKYLPKNEMRYKSDRAYKIDSRCKECGRKRDRKRMQEKWAEEHNTWGSKIPMGKVVGRKPVEAMRHPPMDAEIPLWYRGMGYYVGYYCKG